MLAQHTLGYLFSARPHDRASYFKAVLEVTDLEELRGAVAALGAEIEPRDDPNWSKLLTAAEIEDATPSLLNLLTMVPSADGLAEALDDAVSAVLTAAGADSPQTEAGRLAALEALLSARRAETFPVDGFRRNPLPQWSDPPGVDWDALDAYLSERGKVDEETRRLAALFTEALAIPAVAAATNAIDCPLCDTGGTLTPERIAFIRTQLAETEAFQTAERAALEALRRLNAKVQTLDTAIAAACPHFLQMESKDRRGSGFRMRRIRSLLGDDAAPAVDAWLERLRDLARARTAGKVQLQALLARLAGYVKDLGAFDEPQIIKEQFSQAGERFSAFSESLARYGEAEQALVQFLTAVIDAASDTAGWQDFIDLARDPRGLRNTLIERHARTALQEELTQAVKHIDRGNEKVLDDKFDDLSDGIRRWWDLLRPGEPAFFSGVKPRKGARRTVDFKAGLSLHADRSAPKVRDVIAVFSQSQLHCLGLALFIARALHEGSGFVILDDPILSSDEDYRAHFKASVLEALIAAGVQIVILTQDHKTWKDLEHRYLHANIDMFQMALLDPADGTTVTNTGDDLTAMIERAKVLARGGHTDLRKQAGELLRNAAERFCKEMLVRDRWAKRDRQAAISDYDGKNLGQLSPQVEPLLGADPSHPGKLRSIGNELNPAKHDDGIPDQGTLSVALGDLRYLKKRYLAS